MQTKVSEFVEDYDHVFNLMLQETKNNIHEVATRAYIINEDRFYLFPVFSLESLLIERQERLPPNVIHRFIQHSIQANQRHPQPDSSNRYRTNLRLFEEGFSHLLMNTNGQYQVVINLYRDSIPSDFAVDDKWQVVVQNQFVATTCNMTDEILQLESVALPCSLLTLQYTRDDVFLIHPYQLYRNDTIFKLTDFFFPNKDHGYYFS